MIEANSTRPSPAAAAVRATGPRSRRRLRTAALAFTLSATLITATAAGQDLAAASTGVSTGVGSAVLVGRWSGGYGSTGGYGGYGASGSGSAGSTTTSNGSAASAAESRGVVLIDTVLPYDDAAGAGTGMVLTANGQVLTNYHVVEGASTIRVTVASTGTTYTATVVGSDATDDVALLQLKNASGLATVRIDDDSPAVGDQVRAVGNAGGTGSLTSAAGSVSSLSATITTQAEESVASETLHRLIETDADVVPGDSGGPLYDSQGEVIGMDTAASSGAEVDGYAIAIDDALAIVSQIRSGDTSDGVRIGPAAFLGVEVADVSTTDTDQGWGDQGWNEQGWSDQGWGGDQTGVSTVTGAAVAGVVSGSAAAKAGLTAGDVITAIGGTTVTGADQVSGLLAKYSPGDRVAISWTDTDGTTHHATVTLGSSPVA